jgi:cation diffusion facilitator family transporter
MILEIGGGLWFGSLALVADGLHMSTHAFAFLITALSYSYARREANNTRFVFGTGKIGDLAAYTSAILLFLIALVILYEGLYRFIYPQKVNYLEAIPGCTYIYIHLISVRFYTFLLHLNIRCRNIYE